jgi:hypothetical protein
MATKRSIPFEEAREIIRAECIGSRKQYTEWHKANKPKKIPRYPNRAYADDWKGWNDFLGNNNSFDDKPKQYRPFAEALAWAHTLNVKTQQGWLEYVRENRETMPDDIPSRPEVVYDDWISWMHWLGNKPREKVEAQRKVERESAIFYCIQEKEYADQGTIFTFGIKRGGVSALKESWERQSTGYYGSAKIRIVPHINQLLWDISNHLMVAQVR